MITQESAHSKTLEVILEHEMQEKNHNSFSWTTSSSRSQRPHSSQVQTTHLTCVTPTSYSAAVCCHYCDIPHCSSLANRILGLILTPRSTFYFTNQHSNQQPPKSRKLSVNKHKNSVSYLEFFFCVWNLSKFFSKLIFKGSYFVIFDVNAETEQNS